MIPFDPAMIEEGARCEQVHGRSSDAVALSTAISLKRIADALGGMDASQFGGFTNLAWEMGRSFEAGRRTDR